MEYTKEQYQEMLNDCLTKADFCRKLGLKPHGGNYLKIDKIILENDLDFSHYKGLSWNKGKKLRGTKHQTLDEILVENSTYKSTYKLKYKLWDAGLKPQHCENPECNCTLDDVKLELHHINGNPMDNRLENLQILCPNCHSKTENYRSKNVSIVSRIHLDPSIFVLTDEEVAQREEERKSKKHKKGSQKRREQICPICGKSFYSPHLQKYCSVECYRDDNKGNRPDVMTLLNDFKELKSYLRVGAKYNVTDNAVRKWCKYYSLPIHSKEMKEYLEKFK